MTAGTPGGAAARGDAPGETATIEAGRALAATLDDGAVVLLEGDLGAGKTVFVRGLAIGLSVDPDDVTSPTFTLIQEYRGARTLYHADLYRLTPAEVADLGLEELPGPGAVLAVEWPDRWLDAPETALLVRIERRQDDSRAITIVRPGSPR
jgi:tRNA threonylcarbamoyladenosine biosynthesis protein TsaE